ncbi:MAG: DUF2207 domain-containing protein, partial [Nitrospirales bacterium]|nr:DUF2207 domain-containing protein [Nitrospirales bacterium]
IGAFSAGIIKVWKSGSKVIAVIMALGLTGFMIPFLVIVPFTAQDIWAGGIFLLIAFINILFYYLLRAPTSSGRKVMDLVEGFRMFLSVTEKDRLNLLNPPDRTPELFEKYLPYALALDVEQEWAEQFAGILEGAQYQPSWYSGRAWDVHDTSGFGSSLGSSFSSAIASSSTAPGSSSGGGGGGSSGGGGGGGGGGGW